MSNKYKEKDANKVIVLETLDAGETWQPKEDPFAGGSVPADIEADTLALNVAAFDDLAGLIVQAAPTRVSVVEDTTQTDSDEHYQVVSVWDKRTFDIVDLTGGSGGGDANAAMRIICEPELSDDVTDGYYTGLIVAGFIGDADNDGNEGAITKATAVHTHWDMLRGDVGTIVGYAAHIGLIDAHADTAIGFEVQAINQISGTYDDTIGFRMPDGAAISGATRTWGLQIGDHASRHRGDFAIGGDAITTEPSAKLEVTNFDELTSTTGGGKWFDQFDLGATTSAGDDMRYHRRFLRHVTSNATTNTIGFGAVPTSGVWVACATVYGVRSNLGACAAYRIWQVNLGTTQKGAGVVFSFEDAAGYDAALVNVFGVYGINLTGVAAGNVTWHVDLEYWIGPTSGT